MKRIILSLLLLAMISLPIFGQSDNIEFMVARNVTISVINIILNYIDGTSPLPYEDLVQTSPGTYMSKGTGKFDTELIVVIVTNNILGVVSFASTETGLNAKKVYDLYYDVLNKEFILQNVVINTNSIRGTLIRNNRRYSLSLEYSSQPSQVVMVVTKQF